MQTIKDLGTFTFPALYRNTLKKFHNRNALSFVNGEPVTYSQLDERVRFVKKLLKAAGLSKGSKAAVYSTSSPNWGASYLGIVNSGCIAVPLLPDFTPQEVKTILVHAEVSCLFVAEKMYSRVSSLEPSIIPFIINLDTFEVLRGSFSAGTEEVPDADVTEQDTASIIYTSGTTGRSKGVELTHKNLVFCAVQSQTIQRIHSRDRCLSFLPLSHVYEFTLGFVLQILNGSCIYYLERPPTVTSLLPAFKKIRPTIVLSVPMVMEKIYKHKIVPTFTKNERIAKLYRIRWIQKILHGIAGKSLKRTFGGHIKFFGIGGAKVDPLVERFMKDAKFNYAIGYGLTETSPLLAGSGPKQTVPGTIGPVMRGVELQILDPDPVTGIGEVVARGDNVMKGYYKEPVMTAEAFTTENDSCGPGWFKTGDLGELRNGIWLSLKGRSKNMILGPSGENIYPEDIEFVLNQHPLVLESLVVEDEKGLVALVQLNEEKMREEALKRLEQRKIDRKTVRESNREAKTNSHEDSSSDKPAGSVGAAVNAVASAVSNAVGNVVDGAVDAVAGVVDAVGSTVGTAVHDLKEDIVYMQEEILSEIQFFVNNQVNRMSKIGKIFSIKEFEKTASQKIKRYLYNSKQKKNTADKNKTEESDGGSK